MKIYLRYISFVYIKFLFIIFLALEGFYVGIDILTNLDDFPSSANLGLLYAGFIALGAVQYTLPLSLIFAMILMAFTMIRNNELISFYSLGISKRRVLLPPFFISLVITIFYVYLNTTPFAYASEYKSNLENFSTPSRISSGIFLKYDDKYLYIKELNSVAKAASDIKIFYRNQDRLERVSHSKRADYSGDSWKFYGESATILPLELGLGKSGLRHEKRDEFYDLKGFDPSSIEKIYESSNVYSIKDAILAIKTFNNQGVNVDGIKAALYSLSISPFFAPFMMVILFFYLPVTARFFNLALLSFGFFIATLCVWGVIFVMTRFSLTATINPEIGVIAPILVLATYSSFLAFRRH